MRARATVAGAALALGVLTVSVAWPRLPDAWGGSARPAIFLAVAWVGFAAGARLVCRLPVRTAVALILLGGVALPLAAAFAPPRSSDDMYRYQWDGRVQSTGTDPYRYVPAAPELVGLRDAYLWPEHSNWCVTGTDAGATVPGPPAVPGCTLINRPLVHTIYPPVAEAIFVVVDALSPPGSGYLPFQLAASAFALATTIVLVVGLRRLRLDPRRAVWCAWCPAVALEAGSNAHIDVAAACLTALALLLLARAGGRRWTGLGGVVLGLAIACKLTPALAAPALSRRRPVLVLGAAGTAIGAVYLPHVLAVGGAVVGYLPGYLHEEGYANGSRFALVSWLLPDVWAAVVAVAILGAVAVAVAVRADPDRPWLGAATMAGTTLLVTAPGYPWYALLLVVFVALGGHLAWLGVAAAGYLVQYADILHLAPSVAQRLGYATAAAAVIVLALRRHTFGGSGRLTGAGPRRRVDAKPQTTEPARMGVADRLG